MDNKKLIVSKLYDLLVETRRFNDLADLFYTQEDNNEEYVIALFSRGGIKKINVTADSEIALIKDVLDKLL